MKKRAARYMWLDTLRGLATVFVLLGHELTFASNYILLTSPIKIPLFFCLSGFLFNDEKGNTTLFFRKMTYRIILPWLILAFFPRVCASIIRGPVFLIESAKSILLGDMTWYFPCCIISLSIWFFQNKLIKNQWLMILSPLLLGSLGFILAHEHILDFLFINNALISQIFLLLGRELKIHMASVEKLSVKTIILIFTTYIILAIISCILFPGQTMDIHTNRYYNIFLCLAMIFTGNLFLFSAASRIVVKWNPLAFIGQNSILFYLWGGYMAGFVKHFLEIIHVPSSNQILYALIVTILTCVGCGVTAIFINRYLPFVNGKRR